MRAIDNNQMRSGSRRGAVTQVAKARLESRIREYLSELDSIDAAQAWATEHRHRNAAGADSRGQRQAH